MKSLLYKWLHKFRNVPSLAAIANEEEGEMLIKAAIDDSIKSVTVRGKTYTVSSSINDMHSYDDTDEEIV